MGGNLVTWKSKKQSVVARSSAKVEHKTMAQGDSELLWLRKLLELNLLGNGNYLYAMTTGVI